MPAELPFDPEVDREALERRRDEDLRARRKHAIRRELHVAELEANPDDAPRLTRRQFAFTKRELELLDAAARTLRMSRAALLRRSALAVARRLRSLP